MKQNKNQKMRFYPIAVSAYLPLILLLFGLLSSESHGQVQEPGGIQEALEKSARAKSTTWLANILRSKTEPRIQGLELISKKVPVTLLKDGDKFRPAVEVMIEFKKEGWNLFIQGVHPVTPVSNDGRFKIFAYLNGKINEVALVAKGPKGATETETFYIFSSQAQELSVVSTWEAVKVSIGSTYMAYKQTGFNRFESWSGLLAISMQSPKQDRLFGYLAGIDLTALTATSNQEKFGPQIGHGQIDGIYFFPERIESPWQFQIKMGIEYLTMLSNGSPFGFNNLIFPSAGFSARKIISAGLDYVYNVNVATLTSKMNFQERYIELSAFRGIILPNFHRGELGLRFINLSFLPRLNEPVDMSTISFILGYTL